MADLKISALPAATVPVAGTEVLPIVQSGTTKQVSIDNLVASRASLGANTFTAAQEWATGTAIASAATINLDTATGNRVHVTGTTTITAVTLTRGPRTVIFDGILTLTHNATNNNLPGGANITTAAGDRAIYESDGTTVYCVSYIKVSGEAIVVAASGSSLLRITRYTSAGSGTWTKPGDTVSVRIRTIGGGGGGSGGGAGSTNGGTGGSSGGYAELYIASAASSYAYVVGAGGAAGGAATSGGAGGATTIAGIAGGGGTAGSFDAPMTASTPTGGDINVRGSVGTGSGYGGTAMPGGCGGVGPLGGGGGGGDGDTSDGTPGVFGSGGGGGACPSKVGGAGGAGYIEIQEYS